jgi:deoxyadenosine/deoxycytidine kinase
MYIAFEGVIGVGKTSLARLLQTSALEEPEKRRPDFSEQLKRFLRSLLP